MPNPTTANPNNRLAGLFSAGPAQSKRSASRDDAGEQSSFDQVLETSKSKSESAKREDRNTREEQTTTSTKKSSRASKPRNAAAKTKATPSDTEESEAVTASG